jgi:hypothetical protein
MTKQEIQEQIGINKILRFDWEEGTTDVVSVDKLIQVLCGNVKDIQVALDDLLEGGIFRTAFATYSIVVPSVYTERLEQR